MISRTEVLAPRTFAAGTYQMTARNVPDDVIAVVVIVPCCTSATPTIWSSASTFIDIQIEASYDAGATWVLGGRVRGNGGIVTWARDGSPFERPNMEALFRVRPGANRRLRGTVLIEGGSVLTGISIDFLTDPTDAATIKGRWRTDART